MSLLKRDGLALAQKVGAKARGVFAQIHDDLVRANAHAAAEVARAEAEIAKHTDRKNAANDEIASNANLIANLKNNGLV